MTTSANCASVINNKENNNTVSDTVINNNGTSNILNNNVVQGNINNNKENDNSNVNNNTSNNKAESNIKENTTAQNIRKVKDKIAILVSNNKDKNKEQNVVLNSLQAGILLHDKEYVVFDFYNKSKDIENIIELLIEQNIMYATICNNNSNKSNFSLLEKFKKFINKYNNDDIKSTLIEAGISIIDPNNITGNDIAKCGLLTTTKPSSQNIQDIASGIFVLNNLGRTNTGQSAISQLGKVIGIETEIENTEHFINRCISYKLDKKGGVLIKTTKPKQKENLLFPTIDCNTIIKAHEAKLDGIVINANYCRIIDINNTIKLANKRSIFILSI